MTVLKKKFLEDLFDDYPSEVTLEEDKFYSTITVKFGNEENMVSIEVKYLRPIGKVTDPSQSFNGKMHTKYGSVEIENCYEIYSMLVERLIITSLEGNIQ